MSSMQSGAHADEGLAHAGTFYLEHADRFTTREHFVGQGVIERDGREIDLVATLLLDEIDSRLQDSQRLQAEEVELNETGLFDPFHVELGDRHVGARIAVHRHQLRQRAIADDDTGSVGRGVAVETLDLLGYLKKPRDHGLLLGSLLKLGLLLDRL